MAQRRIQGITIAINADTSGVTSGLKDLTDESIQLSKQLKAVESLLDMDEGNTELIAQKQELLAKSVETTKQRLEALKGAQSDVQAAFQRGDIGRDEYIAFQRELITTEQRLKDLEKQSDDTGEEVENLGEETGKTGDEMKDAEKESGKFGETLKSAVAKGAELAAAGIAAMAAAATAAVGSIINAAGAAAEYGDNIDKMSQKLGMSAESYQEWDFIMQHSGSDIDKMTSSMNKLADAVQEPTDKATAAFEKLGISIEDAQKMSQEELFSATITALQKMESGTERTALANDLLGKSAMDLGALLNTSAEETEAMRQQVHDLGGVMDDEAVKTAAAYQDSLQNVKTAIGGITRNIGASFMPSMIKIMDATAEVASGNNAAIKDVERGIFGFVNELGNMAEQIADTADKILPMLVDAISRALPKLINAGLKIVKTLADAIIKNLPTLLSAAGKIILEISRKLLEELPQIVRIGLQVIMELARGIAEALPELVPAVVEVVLEIVDILTDPNNLSDLIDAAIAIIFALTDGLIQAAPVMIERVPEIVENLMQALIDNAPKLLDAAWELIKKLGEYLTNPDNLTKIGKAAWEVVKKFAEGIGGALWKIAQAARDIVEEIMDWLGWGDYYRAGCAMINDFMDGVKDTWDSVQDWWENFGEQLYDYLHPTESAESHNSGSGYAHSGGRGHFARGIIATAPTRAVIGENGAEVVLPLENHTGWMDVLAQKLADYGGSGGFIAQFGDIYVQGGADAGQQFIQQIDTALRRYQLQQQRGIGGTGW